jgi:hypothetical protein
MFGYFIGLFWGFIFGGIVGISYNFIKNISESYFKERNPKKILMKKIYEQLANKVFEQFYMDIESMINVNNLQLQEIPKIEEIVLFTHNIMNISKYYNDKFVLVYDNKNDKIMKIKILDNELLNDKSFIETMTFLTKNKFNVCMIYDENVNKLKEN